MPLCVWLPVQWTGIEILTKDEIEHVTLPAHIILRHAVSLYKAIPNSSSCETTVVFERNYSNGILAQTAHRALVELLESAETDALERSRPASHRGYASSSSSFAAAPTATHLSSLGSRGSGGDYYYYNYNYNNDTFSRATGAYQPAVVQRGGGGLLQANPLAVAGTPRGGDLPAGAPSWQQSLTLVELEEARQYAKLIKIYTEPEESSSASAAEAVIFQGGFTTCHATKAYGVSRLTERFNEGVAKFMIIDPLIMGRKSVQMRNNSSDVLRAKFIEQAKNFHVHFPGSKYGAKNHVTYHGKFNGGKDDLIMATMIADTSYCRDSTKLERALFQSMKKVMPSTMTNVF